MHRYKEEHIKMQIVSCQYFSRGGRIREGLQSKKSWKFKKRMSDWLQIWKQSTRMVSISDGQWLPWNKKLLEMIIQMT